MAVEARATPLANKIIEELPRRSRRAFDQFEAGLAARGCAALAYRLSGDLLDHLCVVHLIGALRVIVAFESAEVASVILVWQPRRQPAAAGRLPAAIRGGRARASGSGRAGQAALL